LWCYFLRKVLLFHRWSCFYFLLCFYS
jgi:hypothetical protein